MWTETKFFDAFARHGMLQYTLTARKTRASSPFSVKVGYFRPDRAYTGKSAQSSDHEIEYEFDALPWLVAGMEVTLTGPLYPTGAKFEVREPPFVAEFDAQNNNGHFRHAILTAK
jgi:hypothetical protein